ncbi:MAG: lysylphosphatidylglycerol synthase transmembrane domain-containing protein [Chloroflexota bacterium]
MTESTRRFPWSTVIGILLLGALGLLLYLNRHEVEEAVRLLREARPIWVAVALACIAAGFLCAGQIYGRVLAALGHNASIGWLTAAAMVTILINQAVPAGSVAAYAFLVASLRRRGFPVGSVAMVAGLELISWNTAVIVAFTYGLLYLLITTGLSGAAISYTAVAVALGVLATVIYIVSRPDDTFHDWGHNVKLAVDRLFGQVWTSVQVRQVVDEILASRRMILEQPRRMLVLVALQLTVFTFHSLALDSILRALGEPAPVLSVMGAYGLALIVSVFTLLPGGGGTVEAALTVALVAQNIPLQVALGGALLFRLLSFWCLLPVGLVCYRLLTRGSAPKVER